MNVRSETLLSENSQYVVTSQLICNAKELIGFHLTKAFTKKNLQRVLPVNIQTCIIYTGTKLSSDLRNIKDPTPFEEQHDIVYHSFCSPENCEENYIRKRAWPLDEIMKDHNGRDHNSQLFKHSVESRHDPVLKNDFRIIGKGYRNNTSRRKIAEALFIKKMKPSLNVQDKSVKLELFN